MSESSGSKPPPWLYRFVFHRTPTAEFEASLYAEGKLEARIGSVNYLEFVSADYRDKMQVADMRKQARRVLEDYWPGALEDLSLLRDEVALVSRGGLAQQNMSIRPSRSVCLLDRIVEGLVKGDQTTVHGPYSFGGHVMLANAGNPYSRGGRDDSIWLIPDDSTITLRGREVLPGWIQEFFRLIERDCPILVAEAMKEATNPTYKMCDSGNALIVEWINSLLAAFPALGKRRFVESTLLNEMPFGFERAGEPISIIAFDPAKGIVCWVSRIDFEVHSCPMNEVDADPNQLLMAFDVNT